MNNFIISGSINKALVERLARRLADLNNAKPLHIILNSQGGHAYCGRAIAGLLRVAAANRQIIVSGYGDIHSAAVIVLAAGDVRQLSKFASVMCHEDSGAIEGNSSAIKAYSKQMEADEKAWCKALQDLTGTDEKIWLKIHSDETYLTPDEALKLNLATELV